MIVRFASRTVLLLCFVATQGQAQGDQPTSDHDSSVPLQPVPIVIDVPDLTIKASPVAPELIIDVPDLTVVLLPPPQEVTIDVPELTLVMQPPPQEVIIDVPELTIVSAPPPQDIVIAVPDLTIVVKRKEEQKEAPDEAPITDLGVTPHQAQPEEQPVPAQTAMQWCIGAFDAHFGRGQGTAVGFAMPFGQNMILPAQVSTQDCGQTLDVTIQGQSVTLAQTDPPRGYTGAIDLRDGSARTLDLSCDADLNLRGQLVAADQNLRIARPVWLLRTDRAADDNGPAPLAPVCN